MIDYSLKEVDGVSVRVNEVKSFQAVGNPRILAKMCEKIGNRKETIWLECKVHTGISRI